MHQDTQTYLLARARAALAEAWREQGRQAPHVELPPRPQDPDLAAPARSFVSWHDGDRLVGCIGCLAMEQSAGLEADVARLAVEAGLHDPRLPPARPEQWPTLECEVSVLGEPEDVPGVGFAQLARALRPGVDGVLLEAAGRRAFFLPQVWRTFPDPWDFLAALARKAGAPREVAQTSARARRFTAEVFAGPAAQGPRAP
jgi:AmmeMemoRadiSam system protein A